MKAFYLVSYFGAHCIYWDFKEEMDMSETFKGGKKEKEFVTAELLIWCSKALKMIKNLFSCQV